MSARRLASGGHIDRTRTLRFEWDGMARTGHPGDTLASALLASNDKVLARSFKYHRPRGVTSAGVDEAGALITLGRGSRTDPNVRASQQELFDGLVARGQNAWPNVRFDLGAVNGLFSRFFSAGFYYKTFMGLPPLEWGKGTGIWMQYEKLIRRAAGMGRASREPDPDMYEHAHAFCDVLVVGSGPAGLAAARVAASEGLTVWLVEQDFEFGGNYLNQSDPAAIAQRDAELADLRRLGVTMMNRTTVFGLYDNGVAGLLERVTDHLSQPSAFDPRQRFWTLRARYTIVAAGALERTMAFGDNDRPGVMTVSAATTYLNRHAVLAGQQIVIGCNNDSAYQGAADLAAAGARVCLLDARSELSDQSPVALAVAAGVRVLTNSAPLQARGRRSVERVVQAVRAGEQWRRQSEEPCDLLLVSGGWSPVVNLLSHRGVKPRWDSELAAFVPSKTGEPISVAGSAAAIWDHPGCVDSGVVAAEQALAHLGFGAGSRVASAPPAGGHANQILPVYEIAGLGGSGKAFVDPQHDVTAEDVRLAHREGYVSVEHLKRYTTLGMAVDQGKVGNVIGIALMADARGMDIPEVGTTTFRPPYTPVSIGALRGRHVGAHFRPLRRTPLHDWNLGHGATMTMAGLWHRPWYFAKDGETLGDAYVREAATVRNCVGVCDVTSLGKIAVQGPDATELLNRVYTNAFAKLPIGKARYGIMLRDDGVVMDDGTTWRLSETEYFMTTTTAHAAKVMVFLEELLQTRWPELRVHLTSVSEQWAGVAVAGPKAREVLSQCVIDPAGLSNEAFPFMGVRSLSLVGDIPCRIARISFSGELGYEVYVPSDHGELMMDLIWPAARDAGGCLYGLEALGALRIEKGHVTGAELDGRVTIEDAGLGKMASTNKAYIGSALRQRPDLQRTGRPSLVGIFPKDRQARFNAGTLLFSADRVSGHGIGWVTGVTHSPALGHWIGIGFVNGGVDGQAGQTLVCADPVRQGNTEVEIVSPHMVDPAGEKLHG